MADARHVQLARELAERDDRVAAELDELEALRADVEELRAHAEGLARFRTTYPGEQERLRDAVAAAREDLCAREAEVAAAAEELARAKEGEPRAEARRALTRRTDAAASAQRKLTRLEAEREALEAAAAGLEDQLPGIEQRALELAERVARTPRAATPDRPRPGLEPVADWASRARAALFVAAASLETERERLVREASELSAAALGDSAIANVRLAAARIEQAADSGTMPASPS